MIKVKSDLMLVLSNVTIELLDVRKKKKEKGTIECDNSKVICDVNIAQCEDRIVKCNNKKKGNHQM